MQAHGSLQSSSFEHGAPTSVNQWLYGEKLWGGTRRLKIPWQCSLQAHVGLGTFDVAFVVVCMVVEGGELGEPPLPEHSEEASPTG